MNEVEIIINGINMGPGCILTIQVSLEIFAYDLFVNGLGDDDFGKEMVKKYLERINDIRRAMEVIK